MNDDNGSLECDDWVRISPISSVGDLGPENSLVLDSDCVSCLSH